MKVGEGILAKSNKLRNHVPNAIVNLNTYAPVCSKRLKAGRLFYEKQVGSNIFLKDY